jgi:cysteine-rich repeat protein
MTADLGVPNTVSNSTVGLANDYASFCGRGTVSGPDAVYEIVPSAAGTLELRLTSTWPGFDSVLYVSTQCGDPSAVVACDDERTAPEVIRLAATTGQSYFVIVDGRDDTLGSYDLTVALASQFCGDGVVAPPEQCDLGGDVPGDGCASDCTFEPKDVQSERCPGPSKTLGVGETFSVTGITVGYDDDVAPVCGALTGGRDRVFAILPDVVGSASLSVHVDADFDVVLSAYHACNPPVVGGLLGCSDGPRPSDPEDVTFGVTGGKPVYLVVDAFGSRDAGKYTLTAKLGN